MFNLIASLRVGGETVAPKSDVRVFDGQLDTRLRWEAHLWDVEAKNTSQMLAMSRLKGSTRGATFAKVRQIYSPVIQPALTYGAPVWHQRAIDGATKGKERRLEIYENQALRNITGAFKRFDTRTIESEAHIAPIGLTLDQLQDQPTNRSLNSDVAPIVR